MGLLNQEALSGVLGHELSHVLNRDILLSSILVTLAGALSMTSLLLGGLFLGAGKGMSIDNGHPLALILVSIFMPIVRH